MKRPPAVSSSDPHILYDSCVNNITSPSMYIVFERDQCYPQYLITFVQTKYLKDPSLAYDSHSVESMDIYHRLRLQTEQSLAISKINRKSKLKPYQPTQNIKQEFGVSIMEDQKRRRRNARVSIQHPTTNISSPPLCTTSFGQHSPRSTSSITTTTSRTTTTTSPSSRVSSSFTASTQPIRQTVSSTQSTSVYNQQRSPHYYNSSSVSSTQQQHHHHYQQQQHQQELQRRYLQLQQNTTEKKTKCVIS